MTEKLFVQTLIGRVLADDKFTITRQGAIQSRQSYVYKFTITGQRGTLWWHANISWLCATMYGPIVILPEPGVPYLFPAALHYWFLNLSFNYMQTRRSSSRCKQGRRTCSTSNAALNDELFFSIAGHQLTIVDVDAVYIKPITPSTHSSSHNHIGAD
jgi:laccase